MMDKIRTHAGRLVLLGLGILLTSTVGHTAARLVAVQMAAQAPGFAFQLATMIAALLLAVPLLALGRLPRWRGCRVSRAGSAK